MTYSDNCQECGKKLWLCDHDAGKLKEIYRMCDKCIDKMMQSAMIKEDDQ